MRFVWRQSGLTFLIAPYKHHKGCLHFPLKEHGGGRASITIPPPNNYSFKELAHPSHWRASPCPECGRARVIQGFAAPGETVQAVCVQCAVRRV